MPAKINPAAICKVNYAAMYRQLRSVPDSSKSRRGHSCSMRVVGKPHNVASTVTMIEYLLSAVRRLSKTVDGRHRNACRLGVSTSLRERLLEMWKAEQAASNECRELVLREDGEARARPRVSPEGAVHQPAKRLRRSSVKPDSTALSRSGRSGLTPIA